MTEPTSLRFTPGPTPPSAHPDDILGAIRHIRRPLHVVADREGRRLLAADGEIGPQGSYTHIATLPALHPERLGDPGFCDAHGTRFPYVVGEMANGIATARMTVEAARAGMLGFFGAAGLSHPTISAALDTIQTELAGTGLPYGANLIHSPNEPDLEAGTVELFLKRGVVRVSASAYMGLTLPIVRYAVTGLRRGGDGQIVRTHRVFAKVSRPEVAARFLAPAPVDMVRTLVERGLVTEDEARLAAHVPVAEDITAEANSGGHTDNRPLVALLPLLLALRDAKVVEHGYTRPIRVGAAGGLGTPTAVAAAFQLGAAYVLTGSVNQGCVELGLSEIGRKMLATAGMADVVMAPAADMFELGVKVQVLRRGTMFGVRAHLLYDTYIAHKGLNDIPAPIRTRLEQEVFKMALTDVVAETRAFWGRRDPRENDKAAADPKHEMALVFRWYLGLSSRWAIAGTPDRAMDYQIWAGPAQGAFNDWVKGSFLEAPEQRTIVQVGRNLLEGAAVVTRAHMLRAAGVSLPASAFHFAPRVLA